jgi:hypothetical protein
MVDVWNTTEFTITDEHLKLSRRMYVGYNDYCEFGAPEINPKRPYGNSSVHSDMMEILGIEDPRDPDGYDDLPEDLEARLDRLHREMQVVLQIWLCTGVIQTGVFVRTSQYDDLTWKLKHDLERPEPFGQNHW